MEKIIKKISLLFFILLPFIDIVTALFTRFHPLPISLGIIVKGIYSILLAVYVIFYSKSKYRKVFLWYLIGIFIYLLLYIFTKEYLWNFHSLFPELITMYKFLFTGLLLFEFIIVSSDLGYDNSFYKNIMVYTLIAYTLLLLVPYFTKTGFTSYNDNKRIGYIGWFFAGNEISAIMLILVPFYFTNLKSRLENKKWYYLLLIIPIIYAIFLLGTKASWYGLLLLLLTSCIIFFIKEKKNKKMIVFTTLVFLVSCLLTFIAPTTNNVNLSLKPSVGSNKKAPTLKCGTYHKVNEFIKDKKTRSMLQTIFSGRQHKAYTLSIIYKESNLSSKLLGPGFTNSKEINNCYVEKYIEMDFFDIFFHYGILGFILILFPYIYVIYLTIKSLSIKKIDTSCWFYLFDICLLFMLSFLSGHIIGYPSVGVYLVILILMVWNYKEKTVNNK